MTTKRPSPGDRVRLTVAGKLIADAVPGRDHYVIETEVGAYRYVVPQEAAEVEVLPPDAKCGEVWDFEGLIGLVVKRPHFVDLDVVWSDGSSTLLRHCVGPMRRLVPADALEVQP